MSPRQACLFNQLPLQALVLRAYKQLPHCVEHKPEPRASFLGLGKETPPLGFVDSPSGDPATFTELIPRRPGSGLTALTAPQGPWSSQEISRRATLVCITGQLWLPGQHISAELTASQGLKAPPLYPPSQGEKISSSSA